MFLKITDYMGIESIVNSDKIISVSEIEGEQLKYLGLKEVFFMNSSEKGTFYIMRLEDNNIIILTEKQYINLCEVLNAIEKLYKII